MTARPTRDAAAPVPTDRGGAVCASLPPEIAERYWLARPGTFAYVTAQTMCLRCPLTTACLAAALREAPRNDHRVHMMRGAQGAHAVLALARQADRERVPYTRAAHDALRHTLPPLRGAYGREDMRRGRMPDHLPLDR